VTANLLTADAKQIGLHLQRSGNLDGDNGEISFGSIDLTQYSGDIMYVPNNSKDGRWGVYIVNLCM
jgi:hypothetical protein